MALPRVNWNCAQDNLSVNEKLAWNPEDLHALVTNNEPQFNIDQRVAYETILNYVSQGNGAQFFL